MKKDDLSQEDADKILNALDEAIESGPWQDTKFLTAIGKKLQAMRAEFKQQYDAVFKPHATTISHLANRVALRAGQQMVYVSLYSANGNILNSWERLVYNLASQVVTRPIYADEKNVRALIRSKEHILNEAYASVYIKQEDILTPHPDKVAHDKLGHELMTLKDKSLNIKNLVKFYHQTGIYHYEHGRLIREGDMQFRETH